MLQERGVTPQIRRYLDDAPTLAELRAVQEALAIPAAGMMRIREPEFKALGLSASDDDATLLAALSKAPKLIERPIALNDGKAVIGRPPEKVLEIL